MAERTEIFNIEVKANDAINQLAKYNETISQLRTQLSELDRTQDGYRQQEARLTEQIKAATAARNTLSREVQQGIKQEREAEGSIRKMSAELAKMKAQWKAMGEEERKQNTQMLKDIQKLDSDLKKAEAEIGEYNRSVGSYEQAIKNAILGNGKFGSSLSGLVSSGAGVSGMLSSATVSVKAFGSALWALMSNPVFLALAGLVGVGMSFKWFYDYNKGLEEATRLTREFLGLTGSTLEAVRNSIQATADAMDKDYLEVLKAVDTLTAQYGIDAASAIKIVNDGFAAGADLNGDMLDKIQQFAPAFNDAGIGASELVALIQQTRSGVFSEQGLTLIQTASKRIREMGKGTQDALQAIGIDAEKVIAGLRNGSISTFDVIRQVSAALKEVPQNSQEAGDALKEVFGRQGAAGGLAMIESLDTIITDLEQVKDTTGEWGKLQQQQINVQAELNGVLSSMFDITDEGFEEMNMQAKIYGTQLLVDILKKMRDWANEFVDLYNKSEVLRVGIAALGGAFKVLWSIASNVLGGIAGFLGNLAKAVFLMLSGNFSEAGAALTAAGGSIGNAVYNIAGDTSSVMRSLDKASGSRLNRFSTAGAVPVTGTGGRTTGAVGGGAAESASGGSGSTSSGGGASGGGRTTLDEAQKDAEARAKLEEDLNKQLDKLFLKGIADRRERLREQTEQEVEALREKYHAHGELTEEGEAALNAVIEQKYRERDETLQHWSDEEQLKLLELRAKNAIGEAEQMQARQELLDAQMQAELEKYEGNQELQEEITKKYLDAKAALWTDYYDELARQAEQDAEKEEAIEAAKYEALMKMAGAFSEFANTLGEQSKALAIAGKIIALGQIAVEQGKAIAAGIAQAQSVPFPANIAAIATTITAVLAGITAAIKAVKSAKFAEGGDVAGPGTDTSDSIPAMLSDGESVLTARATQRYAPYLSAMNVDGGGVPIYGQGAGNEALQGDVIMQRMANVVSDIRPVVSVVDINEGQSRVRVIDENAAI